MNYYSLDQIQAQYLPRLKTKFREFDELLNGGFVVGSVVLFAGLPGVGKSTFLLQIAYHYAEQGYKVLYVLGEENLSQLRSRAERLKAVSPLIFCTEEIEIEHILGIISEAGVEIIIIDSLQTVRSQAAKQGAGTPTQTRLAIEIMTEIAKKQNKTVILVGHSTKTGSIAGTQTLQHVVDTVLFMDGQEDGLRTIVVKKNRFGKSYINWGIRLTEEGFKESLGFFETVLGIS